MNCEHQRYYDNNVSYLYAFPTAIYFDQITIVIIHFSKRQIFFIMSQVDADYKLKDMKKLYNELELKGKGYRKKLDELQNAIVKHLEQ